MGENEFQEPAANRSTVERQVRALLESHWVSAGYAAPNTDVYPWQWLWDSCFHALIWHELERPDRAITELTEALSIQTESGFVPHMNYRLDPDASLGYWGRRGASAITQPPMYGHVIAVLIAAGISVPTELVDRAARGLRFLIERRRRDHESGLMLLCHPWESGADDSPRWDDTCPGGSWDVNRWRSFKTQLVASVRSDPSGGAVANPDFEIASIGFNALVAWNARQLADATEKSHISHGVDELIDAIDQRWSTSAQTWIDAGAAATGSGRIRTADALLALLVTRRADAIEQALQQLSDPQTFGGRFGPPGVSRHEESYRENQYWRGPVWPQLGYLLWQAVRSLGGRELAKDLASATVRGALKSNFSEYWNPNTGEGLGASPQSWTGLALIMAHE